MADQNPAAMVAPEIPVGRLLSIPDVEAIFGRTGRTLRRWERAGHLVPVRVGRSLFYRHGDIERLLAQRMTDAALARRNGHTAALACSATDLRDVE